MMYSKATLFSDKRSAYQIFSTPDAYPSHHRRLGREVTNFDPDMWNRKSSLIVETGNMIKFSQNRDLRKLLLGTCDRRIVEASPYDRIWGIGFVEEQSMRNEAHWGENRLGESIMRVRESMRAFGLVFDSIRSVDRATLLRPIRRTAPETMDDMNCPLCGSAILRIQYQARSADEATKTLLKCPNCPLDPGKLSMNLPVRSIPLPMSDASSTCSEEETSVHDAVLTGKCYHVSLPVAQDIVPESTPPQKMFSAIVSLKGTGSGPRRYSMPRPCDAIDGGTFSQHMCYYRTQSKSPCGWGTMSLMESYSRPAGMGDGFNKKIIGEYIPGPRIAGVESYFFRGSGKESWSISFLCADFDAYWRCIDAAFRGGALPPKLRSIIRNTEDISRLGNLSPRAWDSIDPRSPEYLYSPKVDGERMWVVCYGRVQYYVEARGREKLIRGWTMTTNSVPASKFPCVIDIEYVPCSKSKLIDVLVSINGEFAPASRGMKWTMSAWSEIVAELHDIPITVYPFYLTQEECIASKVGSPLDGVMGVNIYNGETLKLKKLKSLELRYASGSLLTSDDHELCSGLDLPGMKEDDIVEIRFAVKGDSLEIHSYLPRRDKSAANSSDVCRRVISSFADGNSVPDDIDRRTATSWCNTLREHIAETAISRGNQERRIVLDIGTGTGQSIDSLGKFQDVGFLLIEPDEKSCSRLARRVNYHNVHKDPMTMLPEISSLRKHGGKRYIVANMDLATLLGCDEVTSLLKGRVRCALGTFSVQFYASLLPSLSRRGIPFWGCCYAYNNVAIGRSLLDVAGVKMHRDSTDECSVTWGGDKTYKEPYVATSSFPPGYVISKGSHIMQLPDNSAFAAASLICSKVIVVSSS